MCIHVWQGIYNVVYIRQYYVIYADNTISLAFSRPKINIGVQITRSAAPVVSKVSPRGERSLSALAATHTDPGTTRRIRRGVNHARQG